MTQQYDVASLGNAIVDIIASVDDRFLLNHRIAKGTMTLIDEFRAKELLKALADNQQTMSSLHEVAGGSAANTMAGLASLGGKGLFLGKVSDDRLGRAFAQSMEATGVDFHNGSSHSKAATATSMIAVTPDGQRSMNTFLGACREMTPDDVDEERISHARVLYIEGYMWDDPRSKAAIRKAIGAAKRAGRRIAFTLSDPFCVGRYRAEFLELMKDDIDILFANEEEAKALFEVESFEPALQAAREWRGLAVLTRSEKGCVVADPSGGVHVQAAEPVAKVLDTTGAGDQFAAGFLFGLSRKRDLQICARLGAIAAAEVISHYGARPEHLLKTLAGKAGL